MSWTFRCYKKSSPSLPSQSSCSGTATDCMCPPWSACWSPAQSRSPWAGAGRRPTHDVEYLAELEVVLLLFTIGIECSFNELVHLQKSVLPGGSRQVLITLTMGTIVARYLI